MRYRNPDPRHRPHGFWPVLRWSLLDRLRGLRRQRPAGPPPEVVTADAGAIQSPAHRVQITWIGHASFLVQLDGINILLDPVFSQRIGWVYQRQVPAGLGPAELPAIDAVCVSHAHYDHLDLPSVDMLPRSATAIVPSGLAQPLVQRQFARVAELDWWEACRVKGVTVTLVPARHWSRRGLFDTNRSLWGGFVIEAAERAIYFAGDTAWFDGFTEIGRRFGQLDAALLPIGGYDPGWFMEHNHLTPEQAGQAFVDCGARVMVPMHWGCFRLTDEPLREPVERLQNWWDTAAIPPDRKLAVLRIGQTLALGGDTNCNRPKCP